MRVQAKTIRTLAGALLVALALPAVAQNEPPKTSYSRMLNIDALIDNHARFLARRYNLSEDQDAFTQAYLRQKAEEFLSKHREELYDLVDRLVEVRAGGEMTPQELVSWGQRALPIYEEAKAAIMQGNEEWRGILTDEQRKIHDEDLREMYDSFATTEDQLHRIVSGQMTLDEFRKGPARQVPRAMPPVQTLPPANPPAQTLPPTNPPARGAAAPDAEVKPSVTPGAARPRPAGAPGGKPLVRALPSGAANSPVATHGQTKRGSIAARTPPQAAKPGGTQESQWEAYVREFIQKYKLDDGQTQRAEAILKDCQEAAQQYLQRHNSEIEQLDKKIQSPGDGKDPNRAQELAELTARRTKLMEPIDEIFERQLKPRLEKLPTRAQRQAFEATTKPAAPTPAKPGQPAPKPPQPQPRPAPPPPQPVPPPPPQPVPQPPPQPAPAPPEEEPQPETEPAPQNPAE